MTPSSPPSYTFLDTQPSPLLTSLASELSNSSTNIPHQTSNPTAPPNTDPNQSPTHTGPNSLGPTFLTNQPTGHEPHNTQTQNSPLPPSIFDPPNPQTNTDPVNEPPRTHLMITRSQSCIWHNAMYDEYNALIKNGTWLLVPWPAGVNMVRSMWLYKHKFHADGTLSRYKARLVANGSSQQLGVDFDETFSPDVKPVTIRTVLSLVVFRKWPIHQLDVKNAFLNGDLSETVYMHQPPSFVDARFPNHVCRLQRSLYRLKQAPRAWFQRLAGYATRAGFYHSHCHSSLFIYRHGSQVAYLLLYVEDIILTTSSTTLLQQLIDSLHRLHLFASSTTSLAGYTDADWAGCPSTRRSTSGYCVFLGDNLLSWSAKRQHTLSRFSAEAEYRGVANVVAETSWLHNHLRELHSPLSTATLVYCNNISAVYMSANHVQHRRTKHIEIDIHFVRDMVIAGQVRVLHVPSRYQYADIFTKGLPSALFEEFRSSLSVRSPPAQNAEAY
ncbi:ribonuclease H-like domain-containing protein [Tanacetum coccineum]